MPQSARIYIDFILALGAWVVLWAATHPSFPDPVHYACCLTVAVLASGMKVRLPRTVGTFSLNFCFSLICIAHFSLCETILLALASAWVQCVWNSTQRPVTVQICFSMATLAVSSATGYGLYQWLQFRGGQEYPLLSLSAVVCVYFVVNTGLVAGVLCFLEGKRFMEVWNHWYLWSFPYYLAGSLATCALHSVIEREQWAASLLLLPFLVAAFYYYRLLVLSQTQPAPAVIR